MTLKRREQKGLLRLLEKDGKVIVEKRERLVATANN